MNHISLEKLREKAATNKYFFDGVVVVGPKGPSADNVVAVFSAGAVLNDTNIRNVVWSTDDGRKTTKELNCDVRHYFIGDKDLTTKTEMCKLLNIRKLVTADNGAKLYPNTPIGPVLYITVEDDMNYFYDCIKEGMIDSQTRINIENRIKK